MSSWLILLAIICVPLNFYIWVVKLKHVGANFYHLRWKKGGAGLIDFIIDLGGTLFITVCAGGGITALIVGGIGGLFLSLLLWLFGTTPRKN